MHKGEISRYTYILTKGIVGIYVINELNHKTYNFYKLKPGSSFNLIGSILGQESIFIFRIIEDAELLLIDSNDLIEISLTQKSLRDILDKLKNKYRFSGLQYDYFTVTYKQKTQDIPRSSTHK